MRELNLIQLEQINGGNKDANLPHEWKVGNCDGPNASVFCIPSSIGKSIKR